jgi:hypothetical protein
LINVSHAYFVSSLAYRFNFDRDAATATAVDKKTYPAMSQQEVEEWLEHIPVFAVTDASGAGVVLKPDDNSSVFYFFMSPMMANATLNQLKGQNSEMDLRVSAFSLGKIWFNILNADKEREVMVSTRLLPVIGMESNQSSSLALRPFTAQVPRK